MSLFRKNATVAEMPVADLPMPRRIADHPSVMAAKSNFDREAEKASRQEAEIRELRAELIRLEADPTFFDIDEADELRSMIKAKTEGLPRAQLRRELAKKALSSTSARVREEVRANLLPEYEAAVCRLYEALMMAAESNRHVQQIYEEHQGDNLFPSVQWSGFETKIDVWRRFVQQELGFDPRSST
jgi:hypothetical protein